MSASLLSSEINIISHYLMKNLFIVGMAPRKSTQRKNRRYISPRIDINSGMLFLVYVFDTDNNNLVSDGPFNNFNEAYNIMQSKLSAGICSWVVTYNE